MEDKSEELVPELWDMTTTMYPNATKYIVAAAKHRRAYGPYIKPIKFQYLGMRGLPKPRDHAEPVVRRGVARKE